MKLKILLEVPTPDYTREPFVYEVEVSSFDIQRGALWLRKRIGNPQKETVWRIFNTAEWSEIAVDDDELILYPETKKPSGPARGQKVVAIRPAE